MPLIAELSIAPFETEYYYLVPDNFNAFIGQRTLVSFGHRKTQAIITNIKEVEESYLASQKYQLKSLREDPLNHAVLNLELLNFCKWVAKFYCEPLSRVIDTAIPTYAGGKALISYSLTTKGLSEEIRGSTQKALINYLTRNGPTSNEVLQKSFPKCQSSLRSLIEKGVVERSVSQNSAFIKTEHNNWAPNEVTLTDQQIAALEQIHSAIDQKRFEASLLFGVTGSGKTEVYIEAVQHCLQQGKSALIIAPEISLTPQLFDRFAVRLNTEIAVLHSAISQRQRWNNWQAILSGEVSVAIGARSAIFAPLNNLGLIIVDEEHDDSYKQSDNFRYHARDLAVARAKANSCPVILGSATPSIETYQNALTEKYNLIKLPSRPTAKYKNTIELVDLTKIKTKDLPGKNISPTLFNAIESNLVNQQQTFILYNRRGFSSFLQCDHCTTVVQCPACSISLTYHRSLGKLKCHYCGYQSVPAIYCEECRKENKVDPISNQPYKLLERGSGTENIEEQMKTLFPQARILRMDRDSVRTYKDFQELLRKIRNHEADILVGTQMIAKGHDLPNVTLVGVLDCDTSLHFPDFRSLERTFQLLTQVAGRAGRSNLPGKVILQTRSADNHAIKSVLLANYEFFADKELKDRKLAKYPPYTKLLRILLQHENENHLEKFVENYSQIINKICKDQNLKLMILGPAPAPIYKIKNNWRYNFLIKSENYQALQSLVIRLKTIDKNSHKISITFDLDPHDLL